MITRCDACKADSDGTASICVKCRDDLVRALVDLSSHFSDLDVVRARLARYGSERGSARSAETPLPFDLRFSGWVDDQGKAHAGRGALLLDMTLNAVTTWTRVVLDHVQPVEGPICRPGCRHSSCDVLRRCRPPRSFLVRDCCLYLVQHIDWIQVGPFGGEILLEMARLNRQLEQLLDRPPEGWFAGICAARVDIPGRGFVECPHELYATEKVGQIRCRACRTVHDVARRRELLLTYAESILATTTEIARAVVAWSDFEQPASRLVDRIKVWANRGQLAKRGVVIIDGRERSTYRMGDVLDLLTRDARHAEKPLPNAAAAVAS